MFTTGDFREIKIARSGLKTILRTLDRDEHCFLIESDFEYPFSIREEKTE